MYSISIKTEFNAAHKLRAYHGKCESLHGHNWMVELGVESTTLNKTGMVMDFSVLKKALNEFLEYVDHKYLNELKYFKKVNPTSENIAKYIYDGMKGFCLKHKIDIKRVTVWETPSSGATYMES